jgi:hypothetical protein
MTPSTPTGISAPRANISGYRLRNVPNFTPEQMRLFSQLLGGAQQGVGGGLDFLSKLGAGDEEAFAKSEAPAYSAFQKALGQIGSRFAGAGALGSSAFQNATSGAAQSLAENLGSQRMQIQQSAIDRLLQLSQQLLQSQPYQTLLQKKTGFGDILERALPSLLSLL